MIVGYTCVFQIVCYYYELYVYSVYFADRRSKNVLPRHSVRNRTRYPILLGGEDGDDGYATDG